MNTRIHIHHLVVDAPGPVDGEQLRAQIEADLAMRFAGWEALTGGTVDRVTVRPPASDQTLGQRVGETVQRAARAVGGRASDSVELLR